MRDLWHPMLAQFGPPKSVAPLPDGPLLARVLYENPWPLAAPLLVVAAAVVIWRIRRAQTRRGLLEGGAAATLAAGLVLLAGAVTTDRELLRAATLDLVSAVAGADAATAGRILDLDVRIRASALLGGASGMDRDEVLRVVAKDMAGQYRVGDWGVLATQAVVDGRNLARTQVRVRVAFQQSPAPTFSWWKLDWRKGDNGVWRAFGIDLVAIEGR